LISATVDKGNLWILKIQAGDKRPFKNTFQTHDAQKDTNLYKSLPPLG